MINDYLRCEPLPIHIPQMSRIGGRLLVVLLLLLCISCEDATVIDDNAPLDATVIDDSAPLTEPASSRQYKVSTIRGLSAHEALNHCGHTEIVTGSTGRGELFIAACAEASSPLGYQRRKFNIAQIWEDATSFSRFSHAYSCDDPTTIDGGRGDDVRGRGFNFAMGLGASVRCRSTDGGESLDEKVTYRISDDTTNSSFLARWRHEEESAPDVGAIADEGDFYSVTCNEPAAVCTSDVPEHFEYCYAIMDEDGIEEWGGGSLGCGTSVRWGMGGTAPSGAPAVVRVAKDRSSNVYYDFEIRTDKDLLTKVDYIRDPNLVFRTSRDPNVVGISDTLHVFGYWGGSTFYIEGWRWPADQGR